MFSRPRRHGPLDIWPGFVDTMATLLMVIVFVLMTFVVAQLYLTHSLKTKDFALQQLETELISLQKNLTSEQMSKDQAQHQILNLQKTLDTLDRQVSQLRFELEGAQRSVKHENTQRQKADAVIEDLTRQVMDLNAHLKHVQTLLDEGKKREEEQQHSWETTKAQLHQTLSEKINLLTALNKELDILKSDHATLGEELKTLKNPKNLGLTQYRSEFLAKLSHVLGNRSDILVVGDRFVFQSEVFFDRGSAEIRADGLAQLKSLAKTLQEITSAIPKDMKWVLRVDGHTDKLAINTVKFPSNWELSTARAIAVVKALMKEGIEGAHLVAAGFGEYHPLSDSDKEEDMARNRRIEFKLDQG